MSSKQCVIRILKRKHKITFKMRYFGFVHIYAMLWITLGTPGKCVPFYTTLTNFSTKYIVMCKVYTDVGGIK